MREPGRIINRLTPYLLFIALLLLWEFLGRYLKLPHYILPPPSTVALALAENIELIAWHTGATLTAALGGLLAALVAAFPLALIMDRSDTLKNTIYPLLVVSQAVPIFALAPLILIWFGLGILPKVLIVALVCFFPILVNLVEGFASVDPDARDLFKTMQAGKVTTFFTLQLPTALPYFFSGLKIAATYSILGAIIGEWLGARAGLGIYMLRTMHSYRLSHLMAAIVVVVVLSLTLFKLAELGAWLAEPWKRRRP